MARKRVRAVLKALMLCGVLLIPIAPIMRFRNEGFSDEAGPATTSRFWQRTAYVLMPLGAGISPSCPVSFSSLSIDDELESARPSSERVSANARCLSMSMTRAATFGSIGRRRS